MAWLIIKAVVSAIIIVVVSEVAKRQPGTGALIASLPLISILGMIWLWRDTADVQRLAEHSAATFWFVLPSLPMFLVIPMLLKRGLGFWPALGLGCLLTVVLYLMTVAKSKRSTMCETLLRFRRLTLDARGTAVLRGLLGAEGARHCVMVSTHRNCRIAPLRAAL